MDFASTLARFGVDFASILAPKTSKIASWGVLGSSWEPQEVQEAPKRPQEAPQSLQRGAQEAPKTLKEAPKSAPRAPQRVPKGSQSEPKTLKKRFRNAMRFQTCFRHPFLAILARFSTPANLKNHAPVWARARFS